MSFHECTPSLAYGEPTGLYLEQASTAGEAVARIDAGRRVTVPTKLVALEVLELLGVDRDRAEWLATPF